MKMLKPYNEEHEQQLSAFLGLSEKDKRRYAALKARKLFYGGISYLCRVLGRDHKTIDVPTKNFIRHCWIPVLNSSNQKNSSFLKIRIGLGSALLRRIYSS
jgi:hypothetical protein